MFQDRDVGVCVLPQGEEILANTWRWPGSRWRRGRRRIRSSRGQVVGTSGTRGGSFHALFNVISERPPRPHLFGTGLLLGGAATLPCKGGEYAVRYICHR